MAKLQIKNLHVEVDGKEILKGFNLTMQQGEIHALMGPNGTGKSTLSNAIMGHPHYIVTEGDILLDGESILGLSTDQRASRGLFLAFQYPVSISGVTLANFLRVAVNSKLKANDPESKDISLGRFSQGDEKQDGLPGDGLFLRRTVSKRGVLRRRKETC